MAFVETFSGTVAVSRICFLAGVGLLVLSGFGPWGDFSLAAAEPPALVRLRLRLEWRTDTAQTWGGVIEVTEGRLQQPWSLGTAVDEMRSLWLDGNAVWIQRHEPRSHDGCDFSVIAPREARVRVPRGPRSPHGWIFRSRNWSRDRERPSCRPGAAQWSSGAPRATCCR